MYVTVEHMAIICVRVRMLLESRAPTHTKKSAPLLPVSDVPEQTSRLLTPSTPELAHRQQSRHLKWQYYVVRSPLSSLSAPPVLTVLRPESTLSAPSKLFTNQPQTLQKFAQKLVRTC